MTNLQVLSDLTKDALSVIIERKKVVRFKLTVEKYSTLRNTLGEPFEYNDVDFEVKFTNDNIDYYRDDNDILSKKNTVDLGKDIIVLDHNNKSVSYSIEKKLQSDGKFFITNILAYRNFLNLLKLPKISDLELGSEQKILLFSENFGITKIDYKSTNQLLLDEKHNFQIEVDRFKDEIERDDILAEYVKIELIKILKNEDYNSQINKLLTSLQYIIDNANKEFRIYIKKFSFENLKSQITKEKEKYFLSLREILSKIFTQIIAIPISVTVLLFAIEKLNSAKLIYTFLGAYGIVTIFSILIQLNYFFDLRESHKQFLKDFEVIKKDSGIGESEILSDKDRIIRRFIFNYVILACLILITILLLIFSYFYGADRINNLFSKESFPPKFI